MLNLHFNVTLNILCAHLTHNLFAIAKFLLSSFMNLFILDNFLSTDWHFMTRYVSEFKLSILY